MVYTVFTVYHIHLLYMRKKLFDRKNGTEIMTEYIQVFTTVENRDDADNIAKALVEKHLAACVQIIGPLTSYFQWQEQLESTQEYLCLIKSREDLYQELEATIKNLHPYEVPEILAMPITCGGKEYLNWMARELKSDSFEWGKDI
jgi:periplasmic divalent cation tolerance protein